MLSSILNTGANLNLSINHKNFVIMKKHSPLSTVAEIQLSYSTKQKASERPVITCSDDTYKLFLQSWDSDKIEFVEQFKIMLLNRGNKVLGVCEISSGGVAGTICDPKLIFVAALKANASSIILCHNHPSGNLKPSSADIQMTKRMKEVGGVINLASFRPYNNNPRRVLLIC